MLAGGDEIVNVPLVAAYLQEFRPDCGGNDNQHERTAGMIVDLVVKPELDHAEVVVSKDGAPLPLLAFHVEVVLRS